MNRIFTAATAIALVFVASTARAETPFTQERAQVSGHLGYGFWMGDGDLNAYGFGLGARVGYTLDPPIYVGGLFDFYFGETDDVGALGVAAGEVSLNAWLLQGEVGYDIGVSPTIVIRPKAGIGITQLMSEACVNATIITAETCNDDTDGEFSFAPGVEVPIDLGGLFIAPEMRFNLVDDASGFIFMFGAGGAF